MPILLEMDRITVDEETDFWRTNGEQQQNLLDIAFSEKDEENDNDYMERATEIEDT